MFPRTGLTPKQEFHTPNNDLYYLLRENQEQFWGLSSLDFGEDIWEQIKTLMLFPQAKH